MEKLQIDRYIKPYIMNIIGEYERNLTKIHNIELLYNDINHHILINFDDGKYVSCTISVEKYNLNHNILIRYLKIKKCMKLI